MTTVRFTFVIALTLLPAALFAQQVAIGNYPIPTLSPVPYGIISGPDRALWFTENSSNKIGRITTSGRVTEYAIPTANSQPEGIVAGADGALWFIEYQANQIGRITTAGVVTEYPIPTGNSAPKGITAGSDGAIWFTEYNGNKIGRISADGVITEYVLPISSGPSSIASGSDGALWFLANNLGRITTSGVFTTFAQLNNLTLVSLAAGPDGALWATASYASQPAIARITTKGTTTEYPLPQKNLVPYAIAAGPDGALWFTLSNGWVGSITTAGVVAEYEVPGAVSSSASSGIAAGPDGAVWFTGLGVIEQAVSATAGMSVSPNSGSCETLLTFTGNGFAPGEKVRIYANGVGSAVLASATADASGSITATAGAPPSAYGPRLFFSQGQTSRKLGAASFSATPGLMLTPTSGASGSTVKVTGCGFDPLDYRVVSFYWDNPSVYLGAAVMDYHGTFSGSSAFNLTVPTEAPQGGNGVTGISDGARVSAPFTVE